MNKTELIDILNRNDMPGVGCVVYHADGRKTYTYYADSKNDSGIDRAASQYQHLIDAGTVRRVEYIHKTPDLVHFWDWDTKPGSFCAADEFRRYCKAYGHEIISNLFTFTANIDGERYTFDYTPAIDGISAIKITYAN